MTTKTPTVLTNVPRPTPLVAQTFGEPRFHTEGDAAALAFKQDGTLLSVDDSGVLRHWSPDGGTLRRFFLSDLETLWCFAPNALLLASGNDDLMIWDAADGQLIARIRQESWLTALAFSPDGRTLASGHDDGMVRFWDVATERPLGEIAAHKLAVSAMAFAPAGDRVATAGEDRIVRVWDAMNHQRLNELASHTDRIPALAWKPDGTLLVSAGWDTSARVWAPAHPDPLMLLNSHSDQVVALAYSPTGNLLAAADSDSDIYLWSDPVSGKFTRRLRGHVDEIRSLAFNADGTRLASGGADRVIRLWNTQTGELIGGDDPGRRNSIAVIRSMDNRLLVAASGGDRLHVWDAASGQDVWPSGDGPAASVAADPNGRWFAAGGTDHVTRLYDLAAPNSPPRRLEATKPPIGFLAFAPNGALLAQASPKDGLVWLWTPTGDEAALILIEAADGCTLESAVFLPDSRRLAVGGIDVLSTGERTGAVCIWNLDEKLKETVFDTGVYDLAIDPRGRYLAGAGVNDCVFVWDLQSEEIVFELAGHTNRINAVAFSPDGSYLVSAGDDLTIRFWDVLSGRLLVARQFDVPAQSLAFAPDGQSLFIGNADTTCHRIELRKFLEE